MKNALLSIALTLCFIMLFAESANACAILKTGDPKVGSTVRSVDISSVNLEFTSKVFADKSTITVADETGKTVSTGSVHSNGSNDHSITIDVSTLSPGKYKVSWEVFCECGQLTPGDYKFTVK